MQRLLSSIIEILLSCAMAFPQSLQGHSCNGKTEFCDKRYNEVSYPTTHNANSYIPTLDIPFNALLFPSHWKEELSRLVNINVNDQDLDLARQLNDGIRAMKLRIMPVKSEPYACHGMSNLIKAQIKDRACEKLPFQLIRKNCGDFVENADPCWVDPAAQPISEVLKTILSFMRSHPTDIITIFIEDYMDDFEPIRSAFLKSGLTQYQYHQERDKSWPKLSELINNNHRLIVFVNTKVERGGRESEYSPYFNNFHDFVWSSKYHFESVEELMSDIPNKNDLEDPVLLERAKPPYNKLWVLQHFITPILAGNPLLASKVNKTSILMRRVERYRKLLGSNPNFVWVDFYELPSGEPGYFEAMKRINQSF